MSRVSEKDVAEKLLRLFSAIQKGSSDPTCLARWSEFIRARDDFACVMCGSADRISAHHICRKSLLQQARYEPGNGITLCWACHREVHRGFNGRANLQQPMDMEGGEKIEILARLYGILAGAAQRRENKNPYLYYLSKGTLKRFKLLQGFEVNKRFAGTRVKQAAEIWMLTPNHLVNAITGIAFSCGVTHRSPGVL